MCTRIESAVHFYHVLGPSEVRANATLYHERGVGVVDKIVCSIPKGYSQDLDIGMAECATISDCELTIVTSGV